MGGNDEGPEIGASVVARGGVEPPTYRFSGGRSYQLSYLAAHMTYGLMHISVEAYRSADAHLVVALPDQLDDRWVDAEGTAGHAGGQASRLVVEHPLGQQIGGRVPLDR